MSDQSEQDIISNTHKQVNHFNIHITAKHAFIFATVVIFSLIVYVTVVYGFQDTSTLVILEAGLLVLLLSMVQHVITFAYATRLDSLDRSILMMIVTMIVCSASILIVGFL